MTRFRQIIQSHPNIAAWLALAVAMVAILLILMPSDLGLLPGQTVTLIVATVVLAGLCVWIINWD